jgi:hypothetical protein
MSIGLDANNVRRSVITNSNGNVLPNTNPTSSGKVLQGRPSGFGASMFQRINVNTTGGGGCGCGK